MFKLFFSVLSVGVGLVVRASVDSPLYVYPGGREALMAVMAEAAASNFPPESVSSQEVNDTLAFLQARTIGEIEDLVSADPRLLFIRFGKHSIYSRILVHTLLPVVAYAADPSMQLSAVELGGTRALVAMGMIINWNVCRDTKDCDQARNIFARSDFALAFFLKYILVRNNPAIGWTYEQMMMHILSTTPTDPALMEAFTSIMFVEEFEIVLERVREARAKFIGEPRRHTEDSGTGTLRNVWEQLLEEAYRFAVREIEITERRNERVDHHRPAGEFAVDGLNRT